MKRLHSKNYTVVEVSKYLGYMYTPKMEKITLNEEDISFIKKTLVQVTQEKIFNEKLDVDSNIDILCGNIYHSKKMYIDSFPKSQEHLF